MFRPWRCTGSPPFILPLVFYTFQQVLRFWHENLFWFIPYYFVIITCTNSTSLLFTQGVKFLLFPPFSSFFRISSFFPPFWAKCPPCPPFSCLLGLRSLKCTFCGNFRALILYFSKKISSLASLGMILILSHSFGICSVFYVFHLLPCILLHYINSSHNLSCL